MGNHALERALEARTPDRAAWREALGEPARVATVRRLDELVADGEAAFGRLTRLARRTLGGAMAMISFIDDRIHTNKSADGDDAPRSAPVEGSFCSYVVARKSAILVPDAASHETLRTFLAENALGIQTYAGVPLRVAEHVVGALCVLGRTPREYSHGDLEALEDLAALAADQIALRMVGEEISAQGRLLRTVVDGIEEGVFAVDKRGVPLLRNRAYLALHGVNDARRGPTEEKDVAALGLFRLEDGKPLTLRETPMGRILSGEPALTVDLLHDPPGAERARILHVSATPLLEEDQSLAGGIIVVHDVTDARTAQREHEARELLLAKVLSNLPGTAALVLDGGRCVLAEGPALIEDLGIDGDVVGKTLEEIAPPERMPLWEKLLRDARSDTPARAQFERNSRVVEVRALPLAERVLVLATDVTEHALAQRTLERQARELEALSLTDELTGLFNRRGFVTLGNQHMKYAARNRRPFALLYVDVNDLKPVNDRLGHDEGDRLLRDVAMVLKRAFRDSDVVARLGGDEFAALTFDVSADTVEVVEQRLVDAVRAFNERGARPFRMSLSIGTVLFDPGSSDTLDGLLGRADAQMYARKKAHKLRRTEG